MRRSFEKLMVLACVLVLFCGVFCTNALAANGQGGADAGRYVHCTITTENEIVSNGQYTSFSVHYRMEHGKVHEGDYIVVKIPDSLKNVDFQIDPKHFQGYQVQADGSYKLTFNANAITGIAGSFSINTTASNETTESIDAIVNVNGKTSTVKIAGLTPPDVIVGNKKPIEKTAFDEKTIIFGGYDYSESSEPTEIGTYIPSEDVTAVFRIYVNNNHERLYYVTVTDLVPVFDGVTYNHDLTIIGADNVLYRNYSEGNQIKVYFDYLNENQSPIIRYSVTIKKGTALKIRNRAIMEYVMHDGRSMTVIDSYLLKPGNGYSAANAYKTVDKTVITADPDDQIVKYAITFDPNEVFEAGKLVMEDHLPAGVKYEYSYGDEEIDVRYDPDQHTVYMVNKEEIDGSKKKTVTIVTNFADVPEGTDVANTVGNTVHTLKYKGDLELRAKKTVDGQEPGDAVFEFKLFDEAGNLLQTKYNDAKGQIVFDKLYYGREDVGQEYTYTIRETSDAEGYEKDTAVYTVKVSLTDGNKDGILETKTIILKNAQQVSDIVFDNKKMMSSLQITKSIEGDLSLNDLNAEQRKSITFEVSGPDQYLKVFTLAEMQDGKLTLSDLKPGMYVVKETSGNIPAYQNSVLYSTAGGKLEIQAGETAAITVTNQYVREKIDIPVTKKWGGKSGKAVKITLIADGKDQNTITITEKDGWKSIFKDLPKFDAEDGHEIQYDIREEPLKGYTTVINKTADNGFIVINTVVPVKPDKPNTPIDPEPEKPDEPVTINLPKTGDNSNVVFYAMMALISVSIVTWSITRRQKKR